MCSFAFLVLSLRGGPAGDISAGGIYAPCKTETNTDYYGGDIAGPGHKYAAATLDACCSLCRNTSSCKYFSFSQSASKAGSCWLKSSFGSREHNKDRTSGSIGDLPPPPTPGPGPSPPKHSKDACFPTDGSPVTAKWCDYQNLTITERVAALIDAMQLSEKIQQISSFTPSTVPGVDRIGLPAYSYHSEGLHGLRDSEETVNKSCTVFPQTTGMAATGNLSLISVMGQVMGEEARYVY